MIIKELITTISEHWDPSGLINEKSNPEKEFDLWKKAAEVDEDWTGDEFTLEDFENYINNLI